jgi:hypothetical protein
VFNAGLQSNEVVGIGMSTDGVVGVDAEPSEPGKEGIMGLRSTQAERRKQRERMINDDFNEHLSMSDEWLDDRFWSYDLFNLIHPLCIWSLASEMIGVRNPESGSWRQAMISIL